MRYYYYYYYYYYYFYYYYYYSLQRKIGFAKLLLMYI